MDTSIYERKPEPKSSPMGLIASLLLLPVAILPGIYFLRKPMAGFAEERRLKAETELLRHQTQMEYDSLKQDVEVLLYSVGNRMSELNHHLDDLSLRFETVTGVPLDSAHKYASRRIDRAILRSYAFAEVWARLLNGRVDHEQLLERERQFNRIRDMYDSNRLSRLDRLKLIELREWCQQQLRILIPQHERINFIQNEIGGDFAEYERLLDNLEVSHVSNY